MLCYFWVIEKLGKAYSGKVNANFHSNSTRFHDISLINTSLSENRKWGFQDKWTTFCRQMGHFLPSNRPLLSSNDHFCRQMDHFLPSNNHFCHQTTTFCHQNRLQDKMDHFRFHDKMDHFCRQNQFNPPKSFLQSSLELNHHLSVDQVSQIIQLALT